MKWLLLIGVILALPALARAQEATIAGTVTDSTGGVLPGVTVTAVHEASGNVVPTVTAEAGGFRIPVRVGVYRVTAELSGFTTLTRRVEMLVGQQTVLNFELAPSTVQESVTVTGEAPLIEVTQSDVGGNVDSRQLSELPVNGRNWIDLAILAPGNRVTASSKPVPEVAPVGMLLFQIYLDGQEVTSMATTSPARGAQPRFSRDSIGEFEYIANRFDATQGRSSGVVVNAVTKSGTNTPAGTFSGYFRHDRFNAKDFIQNRVLPYSNQQWSATYGFPIQKDKVHFFGHYEFEREPRTYTFSSPFPRFNIDLPSTKHEHKGGGRLDVQLSSRTSLMVRGAKWANLEPISPTSAGGATNHPSRAEDGYLYDDELFAGLTQILSNRTVNQIKGGYNRWVIDQHSIVRKAPTINLRGYTIGGGIGTFVIKTPRWSIRDDLNHVYTLGGQHTLKVGAEYIHYTQDTDWCNGCNSTLDATGGPIPANIEDLFPVWNDESTWNLAPLSPISVRYRQPVGAFQFTQSRHGVGTWVQDDWTITPRLTMNLGVRYDMTTNNWANDVDLRPFIPPNRPDDIDNVGPRLGAAYSLGDRTVLRGGWGKYFGAVTGSDAIFIKAASIQLIPETPNDGRPNFASNPFNGPVPSYSEVLRRTCPVSPGPGCVRRDIPGNMKGDGEQIPYSYQTSIGVQQQFGETMAVTSDYVYSATRGFPPYNHNVNLTFNPATGANYPFSDTSRRPFPDYGAVVFQSWVGRSNDHSWQTALSKRFSAGWQAAATYTLSRTWDATALPAAYSTDGTRVIETPLPFPTAKDLGGEYGPAEGEQRHRVAVNGIWQLPYGFQLSGLYLYGSGARFRTSYGGDLRNSGGGGEGRLRPDGSIVPRNNFVGRPIHRVDTRIQRTFRFADRFALDGIVEIFNLFNHENYGNYVTAESARNYGAPSALPDTAYQPRQLQLGFRTTF